MSKKNKPVMNTSAIVGLPKSERKHGAVRYRVALKAEIKPVESQDWIEAEVLDLSETGARITADIVIRPGTLVVIKIKLAEVNRTHERHAVVIWQSKLGIGIQFV